MKRLSRPTTQIYQAAHSLLVTITPLCFRPQTLPLTLCNTNYTNIAIVQAAFVSSV